MLRAEVIAPKLAKTEKVADVPRFGAVAAVANAVSGPIRISAEEMATTVAETLVSFFICGFISYRCGLHRALFESEHQ